MAWNEDWLNTNRPKASEIPEYPFFPNDRAKRIFGFYAVWFVLVGIALRFAGTTGMIFLDIPILIWITLIANFSSIAVLYFWVYRSENEKVRTESE